MNQAFYLLHSELPREGPGSDASTLSALSMLPDIPAGARVVDIGCGPGRQTLVLARTLQTGITAVDVHRPFLDQLIKEMASLGLCGQIRPLCASMDALPFRPGTFDLIWAEGSIFIIGLVTGLRLWRSLLRPRGLLAFTEATWFTSEPPAEVRTWWEAIYPDIQTESANVARAAAEGFDVLGTFPLPSEDWWTEYYTPLQQRLEELQQDAADDAALRSVIAEQEKEIAMHARFGSSYGYVFYVLRKSAASR